MKLHRIHFVTVLFCAVYHSVLGSRYPPSSLRDDTIPGVDTIPRSASGSVKLGIDYI
jgi:hypothetical protein